jgi:hypothetical protein
LIMGQKFNELELEIVTRTTWFNVPTWYDQQRALEVLFLRLYFHFVDRGCQWFFREFRPPLSWMVGAQSSCTAPKHTSFFNSCFDIMLQDQPGNTQNAFLHHTTYMHTMCTAWVNGLKILKLTTTKYTDCKEKSVN